jgi:hypothetical protein
MTFLDKLLPSEGLVCVAKAIPSGGFQHFFFEARQDAVAKIETLNTQGHTVYLAQATFDTAKIEAAKAHNAALPRSLTKEERKKQRMKERGQNNALMVKNFFLDIDCGEGKPYATQKDAVTALKEMLAATSLPFPCVVNSGNGLYAHWILTKAIPAEQWRTTAQVFKKTLEATGFHADPARTSDSASVLRPPGSTNRKNGHEKPVVLLKDVSEITFLEFSGIVTKAARKHKLNVSTLTAPKPLNDINADFYAGIDDGPRPDAHKIAEKCNQLKSLQLTQGAEASEPAWYACLGVIAFCETSEEEADLLIHEWAKGSPHYDPNSSYVDEKIAHFRASETGPTTCAHFGSVNPEGCRGCRYNSKIKSPIVLGRPEPAVVEQPVDEVVVPAGFRRAKDGLYFEDEGVWYKFHDLDLVPTALSYDASLGYEVATIKHTLPHDGELEFTFRSALTQDPRGLLTCFADNHVKICGVKEKKAMVAYVESYLQTLQRHRRMTQLLCQMGWRKTPQGEDFFVLGRKIFYGDGTVDNAALARNVPSAAEGFTSKGDLKTWAEATRVFNAPGMEPFAFALLSAFAAPLIRFTGYSGAMVSMTGESGAGKTLMLRLGQSVFGAHDTLMMYKEDTQNAMVSRLGVYGSLPLTIDEVTNINDAALSDLVYRVTQGRDKVRLTKNSEERKIINSWNTLAIVSTNSSVVDKLSGMKHDATAEINRIFEYPVIENAAFRGQTTTDLYWMLDENYGVAGEKYIQWLTTNTPKIKSGLEQVRRRIDGDAKIRGEERFWSAVASAAIYGGYVAKSLGLIEFDVTRVLIWATRTIRNMRSEKEDLTGSAVDILGQFLDEHASNRLLVKGDCVNGKPAIPIDTPHGALVLRYEVDNHRLYIARATFKSWLGRKFGSYSKVMNELKDIGALRNANVKKVLGAGTQFGGAQQPCWLIDLKCPKLGVVTMSLVQDAKFLEGAMEG